MFGNAEMRKRGGNGTMQLRREIEFVATPAAIGVCKFLYSESIMSPNDIRRLRRRLFLMTNIILTSFYDILKTMLWRCIR